jgi:hypothetical protein
MPSPEVGIPAGASLLGGFLSSRGQQQAAETGAASSREAALIQAAAAEQALRLQKQLADEQVLRNAPTVQAGDTARNRMLDLIGLSGRTGAAGYGSANQPFSMAGFDPNSLMRNFGQEDLNKDVLFESALGNLNRGSNNRLAAAGLFRSPQRALAEVRNRLAAGSGAFERFQTNRASQAGLFADALNRDRTSRMDEYGRLSDFTTRGANAAAGTGSSQAAYGTNAANLISQGAQAMGQGVLGAGQAAAAGQMGSGNTYNNAIQAALQGYQNNQMMDLFRNRQSAYAPQQATYAPQQAASYDPYSRFTYPDRA